MDKSYNYLNERIICESTMAASFISKSNKRATRRQNHKLKCKINIEERVNIASVAFYAREDVSTVVLLCYGLVDGLTGPVL